MDLRAIASVAGVWAVLVAATTLGGGAADGGGTVPAAAAGLTAFEDCESFTVHVRPVAVASAEAGAWSHNGAWFRTDNGSRWSKAVWPLGGARLEEPLAAKPASADRAGRPDLAAVDGTRVITVGHRDERAVLEVVETAGGLPRTRGWVAFDSGPAVLELLLLGAHRALVIADEPHGFWPGDPEIKTPLTALTLVDFADPVRPVVLGTQKLTGRYISADSRDGVVRLALSSGYRIALPHLGEDDSRGRRVLDVAASRDAVQAAGPERFLPERAVLDGAGKLVSHGPLLGCTDVLAPAEHSGTGILSVLSFDSGDGLDGFLSPSAFGIVSDSDVVHAGVDRLYVGTIRGGTNSTTILKNNQLRPWYTGPPRSTVYAFDAAGRHTSTGVVPGVVLQYAGLSEDRGTLRVATSATVHGYFTRKDGRHSHVLALAERGDRLVRLGEAPGLEQTRHLWKVRWFGPVAAISSHPHRPLRLVDLSDPARPVLGARAASGFFAHVHSLGDGRVLEVRPPPVARLGGLTARVLDEPRLDGAPGARDGDRVLDLGPQTFAPQDPGTFAYLPARHLAVFPVDVRSLKPRSSTDVVQAVLVGADGRLTEAGQFVSPDSVLRILAVGDRLAVITTRSIVLLDPDGLRSLGAVRTAKRTEG